MKYPSILIILFLSLAWTQTKAITSPLSPLDSSNWQLIIIRDNTYQEVKAVWKIGDPIRYALKDTSYQGRFGPVLLNGTVTAMDEERIEINSISYKLNEFHSLGVLKKNGKLPRRKIGLGILLIIFGFYGGAAMGALLEFAGAGTTLGFIVFGLLFGLALFGAIKIFTKKFAYKQRKFAYKIVKDEKEWKKGESFSGMGKPNDRRP
ncbi:MAG: hypothetical protein AAGC85_17125 [Bacteroidota bacterium]